VNENGTAQVSDADFSYITAEDIKNGAYDRDSGAKRDTDLLTFKNKRNTYPVHFPAYSIDRGELTIGDIREQAAKKIGCDVKRTKLLYKGRNLKDDMRTCREEGLQEGVDIMCVTSEPLVNDSGSSDSEDDEFAPPSDQPKRRRNRNRNKKKKGKKPSDTVEADTLAVPGSETSRTASPKPPTPATPLDKLNALHQTLQSMIPACEEYIARPPSDPAKKEYEHKRLSETILTQVLIKLDGVETDEPEQRARRKELVRETQRVLSALDAAKI
jgi:hypothetical protein